MGSTEEAFCLKWNDFQKSLTSSFAELRRDSDLTDVTVIVEGCSMRAHRVILSACSGAFKDLFRTNTSRDPVVMLWDVTAEDMEALFNFMYQGQVNVVQERLNTFLALAEKLRVKGLTNRSDYDDEDDEDAGDVDYEDNGTSNGNHEAPVPSSSSATSRPPSSSTPSQDNRKRILITSPIDSKRKRAEDGTSSAESGSNSKPETNSNKSDSMVNIKDEISKGSDGTNEIDDNNYGGDYGNEYFEAEGEEYKTMMQSSLSEYPTPDGAKGLSAEDFDTGPGVCPWCVKKYNHLRRHVEDIHCPNPTPCPYCGRIFSSRNKMACHKSRICKPKTINAAATHANNSVF